MLGVQFDKGIDQRFLYQLLAEQLIFFLFHNNLKI